MLKSKLKQLLPMQVFLFYHWVLAYLSAFVYRWPSKKMIVIGVTGTSGKSTVVNFISKILEQTGAKTGFATTFNFKIGDREWENDKKMTMLGRFALQKLLKQMVDDNCKYAIIETTSEGIKQYRHLGINYDIAVFTNLTKEHLESHGSFDKYRQAKQKLFKHMANSQIKTIDKQKIKKSIIVNLDDKNKDYFLGFNVDKKYGYSINKNKKFLNKEEIKVLRANDLKIINTGIEFNVNNVDFKINLLGKFNVSNALAAICVGIDCNVDLITCKKAIEKIVRVAGRMEIVNKKPLIIVDYAHTPDSLEKVYKSIKSKFDKKLICVFGSAGGGRDKWKRPILASIAEKYCDYIIVTNEDPYDEDPSKIIDEIVLGAKHKQIEKIIDRKQAISRAIDLANSEDVVIITGKGSELSIMGAQGEKIPWNDKKVVKELLKN